MSRISDARPNVARQATRNEVAKQANKQTGSKAAAAPKKGATDGVEKGQAARPAPQVTVQEQMPAGRSAPTTNPFATLLGGTVPNLPARMLAAPVALNQDLSPDSEVLTKLGDLESAALKMNGKGVSARLLDGTARVRQGVMLTLSDGLAKHTAKETAVPKGLVSNLGETLATARGEQRGLAAARAAMTSLNTPLPLHMDINAFVQAVLRECYLLQNEILKDYADKVKFYNDLKKKIRAELKRSRNTLSNAAGLEDDAKIDPPFDTIDMNNDEALVYGDQQSDVVQNDVDAPPPHEGGGDSAVDGVGETEPPITDASHYTSDEILEALERGEELGLMYAGEYIVLRYEDNRVDNPEDNAPRKLIAQWGDRSLEVTVTSDSFGSVIEIRKLPHMHQTLDFIRIDSFGKQSQVRDSGSPEFSDAYGMTSEEIKAALAAGETLGLMYDGELLLLKPGGVVTYGDHEARWIEGEFNAKQVIEIRGLPGMPSEYQWLEVDLFGQVHTVTADGSTRVAADQVEHANSKCEGANLDNITTTYGEAFIEEILSSLPSDPAALDALLQQWEEKGIEFGFLIGEKAGRDHWYHTKSNGNAGKKGDSGLNDHTFGDLVNWSHARTRKEGETAEEYIRSVIGAALAKFKKSISDEEDASIHEFDFRVNLPGFNVPTRTDASDVGPAGVPSSETQTDSSLLGQGPGSGATGSAEPETFTAWEEGEPVDSKADLEAYVKALEDKLNTIGGDAQLANVDMQNALQRQQQTLQMMSNISKMLHDTAMSIIRKIGS